MGFVIRTGDRVEHGPQETPIRCSIESAVLTPGSGRHAAEWLSPAAKNCRFEFQFV
jgi:hypothetical protein